MLGGAGNALNRALELFYKIDEKLETFEKNLEHVRTEFTAIRLEVMELKGKVAALEESRNTLKAEMERLKAETVAEMKVLLAEHKSDLYTKFVDAVASVKQQTVTMENETRHIEK